MTAARPTTLRLFTERCPAAVELYEAGAPVDRSVFATGTAAHDVLDAVSRFGFTPEVVEHAVKQLISAGRGGVDAEPPLPPDRVFAGRDLAVAYVKQHGLPEGWPELGLAFDASWNPVEYTDARAWFRVRLDLAYVIEVDDEESVGTGLVVRDYKTAWSAGEDLLESIQLRAQAVAALAHWKEFELDAPPDFVRREVINLRTRRSWHVDTWIGDQADEIEQWKRDIVTLSEAMLAKPRIARPGVHCIGCDYAAVCPAAEQLGEASDPVGIAVRYAAAQGHADELRELAKRAAGEGVIETPDGEVGFIAVDVRKPKEDAWSVLLEHWLMGQTVDGPTMQLARGFLARMKWGVSQVESIAKGIMPGRKQAKARRELVDSLVETVTHREFGVRRRAPATTTDSDRSQPIEEDTCTTP